jgi:phenylpropionate dioxygenase-like ring-hydroxylating dioxygenase large terminal subunit
MDESAPPLAEYLGTIIEDLAPYHFERMRLVKQQTLHLAANWKTVRDNFLEQYHVDFIHPQHASMVDCSNSQNELYPFGHSSTSVKGFVTNPRYPIPSQVPDRLKVRLSHIGLDWRQFENKVPDIRAAACAQKRKIGAELGFGYDEFSDEQVTDVLQYDIFPNVFMTIRPEEVWIYGARPHPQDPDQCIFDKWTLQVPAEIAVDVTTGRNLGVDENLLRVESDDRPEPEVFTRDMIESKEKTLGVTIDQDVFFLPYMQAGLHSRGFSHALLNMDEARIAHFHAWVDAWMSASPWPDKAAPR